MSAMLEQTTPPGPRPLADQAYRHLRDAIVSVAIPPGSPLDEDQLMRAVGAGRTPVRQALKRLAMERLVVIYPRRGTFVSDIHISDERWLTEVRIPLEGLAAQLAAPRATSSDREALGQLRSRLVAHTDNHELLALDTEIHRLVFRAAHNPHLEETLEQYFNLALRIWFYCLDRLPDIETHVLGQRSVIDAILAQDSVQAKEAAINHLTDCASSIREVL